MSNEDVLVFPTAWRRVLLPRRGGEPGPALSTTDAAAAASAFIDVHRAKLQMTLESAASDPELAAVGQAYLGDPARAEPLPAAVDGPTVAAVAGWPPSNGRPNLVDAWVAA